MYSIEGLRSIVCDRFRGHLTFVFKSQWIKAIKLYDVAAIDTIHLMADV